jgi:homopolymeric O-antigen transport system permease protein
VAVAMVPQLIATALGSPRISVIIPTYQRRNLALAALESLRHQDVAEPFEVIVVVDGSTDGTAEALQKLEHLPFELTVLEQPKNLGLASARNRGASAARGGVLLFLDDDMVANPHLLSEHDRMHRSGAEVVLGHILTYPESAAATLLSENLATGLGATFSRLATPGESPTSDDFCGGQMSVRRDLFQAVGGFDERFTRGGTYGNEDMDLGHRLLTRGSQVVFNPDAISRQRYVIDAATQLHRHRQQGQADVTLVRKHPELADEVFARRLADFRIDRVTRALSLAAPKLPWLLTAPLRLLVTTHIARGRSGPLVGRLLYALKAAEYWRGVQEAGGIPRPVPQSHDGDLPYLRIQPARGWASLNLAELWEYRELLYFLVWRDIKIRYKQTALGAAWAIIQPFFTMVVFSLFFGRLAGVPSDGVPYPLFSYAALVPWSFFATGLTQAANSMISSRELLEKVYFPRLMIPIGSVLAAAVDFVLAFLVLLAMMPVYGTIPTAHIVWLPFFVLLAFVTSLGAGLWLSTLNVQYRDVRHAVPFLVQFWVFATPVAYPSSLLAEPWRTIYGLNPMAGVVEGFRWALLGTSAPGPIIAVSTAAALVLLISGAFYLRRMETSFADLI